ncbi:MAG: chromate transporter [Candidatus Shapirobacteria bacterium]|nr:chromate transporter [Candidatus Shapirobacteria bacterium]
MKEYITKAETFLDLYFGKKAPQLPVNIKEAIVKFSPYIAILVLVLSLPAILALFSLGAVVNSYAFAVGVHYGFSYYLATGVLVISLIVDALAIPGLFARKLSGWNLMFYSALITALYSLLRLDIVSLIISGAISFYILFQVRSYYKN